MPRAPKIRACGPCLRPLPRAHTSRPRLGHPRSVVAGKARCRTLDALSASMRGVSRKAPGRPCIDDSAIRSDDGTPSAVRTLFAAVDGQPRRHVPPTLSEPSIHRRREPTNGDTPAGIAVTRRRGRRSRPQWSGEQGQTQQAGAEWMADTRRHEGAKPSAVNRSAISVQRSPDLRSRIRRTLNAYPSRSRAMASILTRASVCVRRVMSAWVPSVS